MSMLRNNFVYNPLSNPLSELSTPQITPLSPLTPNEASDEALMLQEWEEICPDIPANTLPLRHEDRLPIHRKNKNRPKKIHNHTDWHKLSQIQRGEIDGLRGKLEEIIQISHALAYENTCLRARMDQYDKEIEDLKSETKNLKDENAHLQALIQLYQQQNHISEKINQKLLKNQHQTRPTPPHHSQPPQTNWIPSIDSNLTSDPRLFSLRPVSRSSSDPSYTPRSWFDSTI
ncbi:MAG: hypothetical protein EPO11_10530 [Gammaproteobacteria bacterium]|nr:MAG: hypothetical protein EPO11_10530 [Gammaproteobacteria bacterium]